MLCLSVLLYLLISKILNGFNLGSLLLLSRLGLKWQKIDYENANWIYLAVDGNWWRFLAFTEMNDLLI